jgi:hemerythrin-like domain-containing protein
MTIIDTLIVEHSVFGRIFDLVGQRLEQADTLGEVAFLGALVEGLLADHGAREENLAYAALDQLLAERGELEGLYQDHEEIDGRLTALKTARTVPEARELLKAAIAASRKHFQREELLIFPKLKEAFGGESLAMLNDAWLKPH